ncbi:hypothetical protein MLD38_023728 [Melastoma candidum]|uniref:Uncharacterized protein n=1 Tax=Melastoma candidum TaxID=119954 RepID=A0ACB9NRF9_9MYRT|nr:hypothetical protein MLD38_023728 [Melastoma candidum]
MKELAPLLSPKFIRDGIDVQTGCRVLGISDKEITVKTKSKGEAHQVPYGLVVWSTGIGPRPLVQDFMEQIDQGKRRMLATDEWLRVKGTENVYALGDCATIDQRKVVEDILSIFKAADKDNSGTLTIEEFQDILKGRVYQTTAQVAAQQGSYLAKCFNRRKQCAEHPEGPRRFRASGRHQFILFGAPIFCMTLSFLLRFGIDLIQLSCFCKGTSTLTVRSSRRGASGCGIAWRLGFHGSQHPVAVVFCLCQQAGQLAD